MARENHVAFLTVPFAPRSVRGCDNPAGALSRQLASPERRTGNRFYIYSSLM